MERRKPVHTIRFGRIKASIWANVGMNGTWHSVQVCRTYKDGNGWKQTDTFGRDDLLLAAKALDQAHTWIYEQANTGRPGGGSNRVPETGTAQEEQDLPM